MSANNPLDPSMRKLLITMFSIGVALGAGLRYGFSDYSPSSEISSKTYSNLAEYDLIEIDMTHTHVIAILGNGTEISRVGSITKVKWVNPDGSGVIGTFQGNKLIEKHQLEPYQCSKVYTAP